MLAVLLVGFGGPDCLDDVGPFIEKVTGASLPPERVAAATEKYRLIGGCSPLNKVSWRQAALLEAALNQTGREARVFVGMKHWRPGLDEAAASIKDAAPDSVVVMCLTPYFSAMSSGDYLEAAGAALAKAGIEAPVVAIKSWHTEPALIRAMSDNLIGAMKDAGGEATVIFTAHSLPQTLADSGDPYAGEVQETVSLIAEAAGVKDWLFGWQSEGHGRGEWLKPTAEDAIKAAVVRGARTVAVSPAGFISDHMETLYDLDIVLKQRAQDSGLKFVRVPGLNDSGNLIEAMASAVLKAVGEEGSKA